MAKSKVFLKLTVLALAVCVLVFSGDWYLRVLSQSPPISEIQFAESSEVAPTLARREELRSRCPCYSSPQILTALMPANNLALTTATHPTFFIYVPHTTPPQTPDQMKSGQTSINSAVYEVEFELANEKEESIYQTRFAIGDTPGIVSFTLPTAAPSLEVGKNYQWYFEVLCDRDDRSGDSIVSGWSRRIALSPDRLNALAAASPSEKPALYAKAGLWHETLTALAELRRSQPKDKTWVTVWSNLLKAVGLDKIAQEPLADCCTLNQLKKYGNRSLILRERPINSTPGC